MKIPSPNSPAYHRPERVERFEVDHSSDGDTDLEKDDDEGADSESQDEEGHPVGSFAGTPSWPQSYKASMDFQMLPASGSEMPSFSLFSPMPRISHSYLSSSHKRSGILATTSDDLQIPFLPSKADDYPRPPSRKPSDPKLESEPDLDMPYLPSMIVEEKKMREQYGSSFMQALLNGLNVMAGVGTLSTPYGIKEGGWLSFSLLFLFAIICLYTGILLRRCLELARGANSYPDIGEAAFGSTGRLLIAIILYAELYVCCVEFLVLEGDNLAALFPGVEFDLAGIHIDPLQFFCIISALIILPTVWLRDLSLLSYLSAGGVFATFLVTLMVFLVGTVDGVGFHHRGSLFHFSGLPVSIGLYGFCYSGHSVFPNIYASMKRPADFDKVLIFSFFVVTVIYGGMGVMGYTMFGDDLESSITLNLPTEFLASKIAVWTTVINPVTKFALSMAPVALGLEELLPGNPDSVKSRTSSLAIRTALVASTVVVATLVPFFGLVMSFIGAFMSMSVDFLAGKEFLLTMWVFRKSVIIPCACFLKIGAQGVTRLQRLLSDTPQFYKIVPPDVSSGISRALCWVIILIGSVCAITGTYSSISAIVVSLM